MKKEALKKQKELYRFQENMIMTILMERENLVMVDIHMMVDGYL